MTYSIDFWQRAVAYVHSGGRKSEACRLFAIDPKTLYHWLKCEDLRPKPAATRKRKLDKEALKAHVRNYPDALLKERAEHFGVSHVAIWKALKRLNIVKKNDPLR